MNLVYKCGLNQNIKYMQVEVNGIKITLTSEQLQEIENQKSNTPEKLFKELIQGIDINKPVVDFEKYPNSIFWFKGDKCLFEYNFKNQTIWIDFDEIWSKFLPYFKGNYYDIPGFMEVQVEQHFKLKGITSFGLNEQTRCRWNNISN